MLFTPSLILVALWLPALVHAQSNPLGSLQVTQPVNATYFAGSEYTVQWTLQGSTTALINVDLINDDPKAPGTPFSIAKYISPSTASLAFTLPLTLASQPGYRVKVWGTVGANAYTAYSPYFTVMNTIKEPAKQFTVTLDNDTWTQCESTTIRWQYPLIDAMPAAVGVHVFQVNDNSQTVLTLTRSTPVNTGFFTFTVPSTLTAASNLYYVAVWSDYYPKPGVDYRELLGGNSDLIKLVQKNPVASNSVCLPQDSSTTSSGVVPLTTSGTTGGTFTNPNSRFTDQTISNSGATYSAETSVTLISFIAGMMFMRMFF